MTSSRNDGDDDDHDSDNVLVGDNHARAPATGGDYEEASPSQGRSSMPVLPRVGSVLQEKVVHTKLK